MVNTLIWTFKCFLTCFLKQFFSCSEGGFFNAIMSFPDNYPLSPPTVRFTSEIWHPNGQYCFCKFEIPYISFSGELDLNIYNCCLSYSLSWWEGLHINSPSCWRWPKWLWACIWALESCPYGILFNSYDVLSLLKFPHVLMCKLLMFPLLYVTWHIYLHCTTISCDMLMQHHINQSPVNNYLHMMQ